MMRRFLMAALALGIALGLAGPATAGTPEVPRLYGSWSTRAVVDWAPAPVEQPKKVTRVAPAANPGCNLSANWRVTASAKWNGTTFSYGVLNSPGPLLVGGAPDGTRSEWFLFKTNGDRSWDGVYSGRDPSKPGYVYRTLAEGGPDAITNTNKVVQVPMAASGAFCLITISRP